MHRVRISLFLCLKSCNLNFILDYNLLSTQATRQAYAPAWLLHLPVHADRSNKQEHWLVTPTWIPRHVFPTVILQWREGIGQVKEKPPRWSRSSGSLIIFFIKRKKNVNENERKGLPRVFKITQTTTVTHCMICRLRGLSSHGRNW